jgi:Flp pilus assembly protein TadD
MEPGWVAQEASAEHFRACVEVEHEPTERLRALKGLGIALTNLRDGHAAVLVLREAVTLAPLDAQVKVSTSSPF